VITDSQAFKEVEKAIPSSIPLTSFSILMARRKGTLNESAQGSFKLDELNDGDKVLISEGCTHHRQCEDIGTVKLPRWILEYTKKKINFVFSSGNDFPEDLTPYKMIIHCGGCMLNEREMKTRVTRAKSQGVAITNYGMAIAYMNGILKRSIEALEGKRK
jgi:[FeFe] hydrogenase H-cluster maturation GTPase HydF